MCLRRMGPGPADPPAAEPGNKQLVSAPVQQHRLLPNVGRYGVMRQRRVSNRWRPGLNCLAHAECAPLERICRGRAVVKVNSTAQSAEDLEAHMSHPPLLNCTVCCSTSTLTPAEALTGT
ncbi:hypothetical protein AAFF_G00305490 [Aldrovandia affinis]|uniref:Uncharacterized protein n=1 Tax=Aldrovandia affinis TaxID=143900 RepID=A0AAD7WRH0_9TELE|nr:hypothetical protein AAFF_G00305490 [Aldrovandia affinis]